MLPCGGFEGDRGQDVWVASLVLIMVTAVGFIQTEGNTTF